MTAKEAQNILELEAPFSVAALKSAHKNALVAWFPAQFMSDRAQLTKALEKTALIHEAYEVLLAHCEAEKAATPNPFVEEALRHAYGQAPSGPSPAESQPSRAPVLEPHTPASPEPSPREEVALTSSRDASDAAPTSQRFAEAEREEGMPAVPSSPEVAALPATPAPVVNQFLHEIVPLKVATEAPKVELRGKVQVPAPLEPPTVPDVSASTATSLSPRTDSAITKVRPPKVIISPRLRGATVQPAMPVATMPVPLPPLTAPVPATPPLAAPEPTQEMVKAEAPTLKPEVTPIPVVPELAPEPPAPVVEPEAKAPEPVSIPAPAPAPEVVSVAPEPALEPEAKALEPEPSPASAPALTPEPVAPVEAEAPVVAPEPEAPAVLPAPPAPVPAAEEKVEVPAAPPVLKKPQPILSPAPVAEPVSQPVEEPETPVAEIPPVPVPVPPVAPVSPEPAVTEVPAPMVEARVETAEPAAPAAPAEPTAISESAAPSEPVHGLPAAIAEETSAVEQAAHHAPVPPAAPAHPANHALAPIARPHPPASANGKAKTGGEAEVDDQPAGDHALVPALGDRYHPAEKEGSPNTDTTRHFPTRPFAPSSGKSPIHDEGKASPTSENRSADSPEPAAVQAPRSFSAGQRILRFFLAVLCVGGVGYGIFLVSQTEVGKDPWGKKPGSGGPVDRLNHQVFEKVKRDAEEGIARAQYDLAKAYQNGKGVAESPEEALKWFRKAAEQGNMDAQNAVGDAYRNGWGVPPDNAEALKWYRRAEATREEQRGAKKEKGKEEEDLRLQ